MVHRSVGEVMKSGGGFIGISKISEREIIFGSIKSFYSKYV